MKKLARSVAEVVGMIAIWTFFAVGVARCRDAPRRTCVLVQADVKLGSESSRLDFDCMERDAKHTTRCHVEESTYMSGVGTDDAEHVRFVEQRCITSFRDPHNPTFARVCWRLEGHKQGVPTRCGPKTASAVERPEEAPRDAFKSTPTMAGEMIDFDLTNPGRE